MLGGWSRTILAPGSTNRERRGPRLSWRAWIVQPRCPEHHRDILSNTSGHTKIGEESYTADTATFELRRSERGGDQAKLTRIAGRRVVAGISRNLNPGGTDRPPVIVDYAADNDATRATVGGTRVERHGSRPGIAFWRERRARFEDLGLTAGGSRDRDEENCRSESHRITGWSSGGRLRLCTHHPNDGRVVRRGRPV